MSVCLDQFVIQRLSDSAPVSVSGIVAGSDVTFGTQATSFFLNATALADPNDVTSFPNGVVISLFNQQTTCLTVNASGDALVTDTDCMTMFYLHVAVSGKSSHTDSRVA